MSSSNFATNATTVVSILGMGYVGLPMAIEFSKKIDVIGFDIDQNKINAYKSGIDPTKEIDDELVKNATRINFTTDPNEISKAKFHIVAVPTPTHGNNTPDLGPLKAVSRTLGQQLTKGSIVVYESTVYPGITEEVCVPILENYSGLVFGKDFEVGYSPERVNPGDKKHTFSSIIKLVSASSPEALDKVAAVYEMVVEAGVHRCPSIKVAEAAKLIENCQRDINIAFMNELAFVFDHMGLDTKDILDAAKTKWNFLNFSPGLVGGHCIAVDPYYLVQCATKAGYSPQIIAGGRRTNDLVGKYVARTAIKMLAKSDVAISKSKIALLGITFKENCVDIRNTRSIDVYKELVEYGANVMVYDPWANADEVKKYFGIDLVSKEDLASIDCLVVSVSHNEFKDINFDEIMSKDGIVVDVKSIYNKHELKSKGYSYWRL